MPLALERPDTINKGYVRWLMHCLISLLGVESQSADKSNYCLAVCFCFQERNWTIGLENEGTETQ